MMSSKNNSFTASDIERYHSGKMSPQEKHALEKAALDDPFLADALEGYAFTSTPEADLAKIQSRLDEKRNQKKVVPIFQKYKWLSAAAIVLIIAGAGWFAYTISTTKNNSITAFQKEKEPEQSPGPIAPNKNILPDSTSLVTTRVDKELTKTRSGAEAKKSKSGKSIVTQKTTEGLTVNNKSATQLPKNDKNDSNPIELRSVTPDEVANNNTVQQKMPTRNNTVSIEPKANNIIREQGFYKTATHDKAPIAGRVRSVKSDTIKDLNIVLQPLPKDSLQSLQEVVVGYGVQKKSTDRYPRVIIDTLEPAEGYVKFDDYIANNLKMPEELKAKIISGEVELSFEVDKEGQPVNITVVRSLCEKCDEEAVRLLKEGPKWKKKKNKKGKITIKF